MNAKPMMRWVLILVSGLALGPWAYHFLEGLRDSDGGHATTLLANAAPFGGFLKGVVVLVLAGVVGGLGSYVFSLGTGYMCAGLVLAWSAWGVSTLGDLVREGHAPLGSLALEGLLVTLAAAGIAAMMSVISKRRQPEGTGGTRRAAPSWGAWSLLAADSNGQGVPKAAGAALGAGIAAGAGVAFLLAAGADVGQAFAAALCGAIAAGVAGQLVASSYGATLMPATTILAIMIIAAVSPVIAGVMHGGGLASVVYSGDVLPLARPLSLQWAAGAMIGSPIGIGWAGAMLDARAAEFGSA